MHASSFICRYLALLVVTAMTWAFALPIVHAACAMEPEAMSEICDVAPDEAAVDDARIVGHHVHDGAIAGHDADPLQADGLDAVVPPSSQHGTMACCVVEAEVLDRSATPARVGDDVRHVSVAAVDAPRAVVEPSSISRGSDTTLWRDTLSLPFSLAFLSVFLI